MKITVPTRKRKSHERRYAAVMEDGTVHVDYVVGFSMMAAYYPDAARLVDLSKNQPPLAIQIDNEG